MRTNLTVDDLGNLLSLPLVGTLATYRKNGEVLLSNPAALTYGMDRAVMRHAAESRPEGMEAGLAAVAFYSAPNLEPPDNEDRVASSAAHGFIVDVAVVEVDRDTGRVHVLDYVSVHDAGRLLNPLIVDGQIRGGFAHGVGAALFERLVYDEEETLLTGTFMDYLVPTAADVPSMTIAHRESSEPARGLGEGNTMSAPAAIANAVADALGVDDVELPLTPPRVWELLAR